MADPIKDPYLKSILLGKPKITFWRPPTIKDCEDIRKRRPQRRQKRKKGVLNAAINVAFAAERSNMIKSFLSLTSQKKNIK